MSFIAEATWGSDPGLGGYALHPSISKTFSRYEDAYKFADLAMFNEWRTAKEISVYCEDTKRRVWLKDLP